MSAFDAEETDRAQTCPEGHRVGKNDLFCPTCLAIVARSPGTYWTINDGRELHPSTGDADVVEDEATVGPGVRYAHRKRRP